MLTPLKPSRLTFLLPPQLIREIITNSPQPVCSEVHLQFKPCLAQLQQQAMTQGVTDLPCLAPLRYQSQKPPGS